MKRILLFAAPAVALLFAGAWVLGLRERDPPLLKAQSTSLTRTVLTPHMEARIEPGKNTLYCCTFQLAWNELKDNILKEGVKLRNEPAMVGPLNKGLSTKRDLSADDYVAMVGFADDGILRKVNDALRTKFGIGAPVVTETFQDSREILAYGYLSKNLRFEVPFQRLKHPIAFQSDNEISQVQAFGIERYSGDKKQSRMASQVFICDYKNDSDFVLWLQPVPRNDLIVIAKVRPEETLLETIKVVEARLGITDSGAMHLVEDETLQIPKFNFDLSHSYRELVHRSLRNKGFEEYFIRKAAQEVQFRLTERGAVLRSESRLSLPGMMPTRQPTPRRLVFDQPFLICLRQYKARFPYFAVWVDNAELMVKQ